MNMKSKLPLLLSVLRLRDITHVLSLSWIKASEIKIKKIGKQ